MSEAGKVTGRNGIEVMENRALTRQDRPSSGRLSADDWTRAVVTLCDRVRAGFGVADAEKFGGWCAEVKVACRGFSPAEIDEAAGMLMRSKMRPNIGEVYAALAAAGRRADLHDRYSRPVLPRPKRNGLTQAEIDAIKARVNAKFA